MSVAAAIVAETVTYPLDLTKTRYLMWHWYAFTYLVRGSINVWLTSNWIQPNK